MYRSAGTVSDFGWALIQMASCIVIPGVRHRGKGMRAAAKATPMGGSRKLWASPFQQDSAEAAAEQTDNRYLQDAIVVPAFIGSLLS